MEKDKQKLQSAMEEVAKILAEDTIIKLDVQSELVEKRTNLTDVFKIDFSKMTEEEKDELYKKSTDLWNQYVDFLKDIDYNVELSGEEYHYVRDLILKDLHYNETDIFIAFKFKEQFLDVIDNLHDIKRDKKQYGIKVKINDLTLLHHLMKNESVKGLDKKALIFRNVITLLGKVYKIFNVWNNESEELSNLIYNWTKGLTPETIPAIVPPAETPAA